MISYKRETSFSFKYLYIYCILIYILHNYIYYTTAILCAIGYKKPKIESNGNTCRGLTYVCRIVDRYRAMNIANNKQIVETRISM